MLTDFNRPQGSTTSLLKNGADIDSAIRYVTPEMFEGKITSNSDWSDALIAADAFATDNNLQLRGNGGVYPVSRFITFNCADVDGINIIPTTGSVNAGCQFYINQSTGVCKIRNFSANGFYRYGGRVWRKNFVGQAKVILENCEFSNNGKLQRTTCVNAIDTSTDYVVSVTDSTGFAANDLIWIGDSKFKILSISGNAITLVNDGTKPTLQDGGTGTYDAGQYFTKDQNGNNGFVIGNAEEAWSIEFIGRNKFNNNGWSGLFCYSKSHSAGIVNVSNAEASGNGYIGLGFGYADAGEIRNNICCYNSNNGIDMFEGSSQVVFINNKSNYNGVDGLFASGNGTGPLITGNDCRNNKRIGILAYGRGTAASGMNITNNLVDGNYRNGMNLMGVYTSVIEGNTFSSPNGQALRIEGKNGLLNPQGIIVSKNYFLTSSTGGDIRAFIGGYTSGGDNGGIMVVDNYYFGRKPDVVITGLNHPRSIFRPAGYLGFTASLTATTGSAISVSLSFFKPNNTAVIDSSAGIVEMQLFSDTAQTNLTTVNVATRTSGIEISNGGSTNGHIIASAAYGSLSYNFTNNTAGTKYLFVKSDYGNAVITLIWS